ncbi:MAG: hypothetical protein WC119_04555 [Synergistaceae bacterium]
MKKLLTGMASIICVAMLLTSCNDSDDTSTPKGDIETSCVVMMKSQVPLQGGDIGFFDCSGNKRIVFTTETSAVRQRKSCSGFDSAGWNDIKIGDTLFVTYHSSDVEYGTSPAIFRARIIEAYREECVSGTITVNSNGEPGCSTCDFFNN